MFLEDQGDPAQEKEANEEEDFVSQELPGAVAPQAVVLQHVLAKQLHLQHQQPQITPVQMQLAATCAAGCNHRPPTKHEVASHCWTLRLDWAWQHIHHIAVLVHRALC